MTPDLIRQLYEKPLSLLEVAKAAGTSVTTVRRLLREAGCPLRPVGATLAKAARR